MAQATDKAQAALVKAADGMAQFYNAHWCEAPKYNVSDKVWLSSENIRTAKKLDCKWFSPYIVEQVISHNVNAYQLKLPMSFSKVYPDFSVTLLHPFEGDPITKHQECNPLLPPLIICDGIEEYKVEKILDSQILCGKVEYLVHWKGYGIEGDKWHPAHDVQGSEQLVPKFHCTHPQAPHP